MFLAVRWPAAACLLAFKPSYILFAPLFANHRSWWIGALLVALAALPLGGLWLQWHDAVTHFHGQTLLYSLTSWPEMLMPFLIRGAATRGRRHAPLAKQTADQTGALTYASRS